MTVETIFEREPESKIHVGMLKPKWLEDAGKIKSEKIEEKVKK
jgi:hypothetical protein